MRRAAMAFIASLAAVSLTHPAAADVRVTFANPGYDSFDADPPALRLGTLNEYRQTLEALGARYLKPGQVLKIEVLSIDRAGWLRQGRTSSVRILTEATPPRMEVQYALLQNGKTILSARETVSDMNYMSYPAVNSSSDRLVYEKEMLSNWFRRRFVEMAPPGY